MYDSVTWEGTNATRVVLLRHVDQGGTDGMALLPSYAFDQLIILLVQLSLCRLVKSGAL